MKCNYCERGMMFLVGDECVEIYQCVGCGAIALKDIELNKNEYIWYKKDTLKEKANDDFSLLAEVRALRGMIGGCKECFELFIPSEKWMKQPYIYLPMVVVWLKIF